ncbi:MAG TPA: type II toxin-antitoxin system VapC family toxin [Syntrophobacteria bacterium]|nr:type II toxin-antitoxin system VapC family toxin [Syntrophobacteria bacterium]
MLDTNIYSDYAEGLPDVVDFMARFGESLHMPSIVLGELSFGFLKGRRRRFNEQKLEEIIKLLDIEVIDVTKDVARKYGLIYSTLLKKGTKIPINDVWIAACCMEIGGTLLTRDQHFRYVDQIESIVLDS